MKKVFSCNRRDFLRIQSLALVGASPLTALADPLMRPGPDSRSSLNISVFSKYLQFLNFRNMSEAVREMGFDGIDLTVRARGHVEPAQVADDLPKATEAMADYGLSPNMITTRVLDAGDATDKGVLETAAQLGYRFYRTGWYKYEDDQEVRESVRRYRQQLQALAKLNQELGLSGSYHNHSGNNFGASVWALDEALEGLPTARMGCQYDIMHAMIEGGRNWEIGLRLISDHINTLVIQDFKWVRVNGKWKPIHVPAGEGMVDLARLFSLLKRYRVDVPVSIHCGYDMGDAGRSGSSSVDRKRVFSSLKRDLVYVRDAWNKAG